MAQTLDGNIKVALGLNYNNSLSDGIQVNDPYSKTFATTFSTGTGSGKAQVLYHAERTLATTTADNLDLAGGILSAFGTATFTKIKAIAIKVVTTTAGYRLEVGAGSNAFASMLGSATDKVIVQADGMVVLVAPIDGYTITAGTGDILKINNPSGGSVVYDIAVLGEGSIS